MQKARPQDPPLAAAPAASRGSTAKNEPGSASSPAASTVWALPPKRATWQGSCAMLREGCGTGKDGGHTKPLVCTADPPTPHSRRGSNLISPITQWQTAARIRITEQKVQLESCFLPPSSKAPSALGGINVLKSQRSLGLAFLPLSLLFDNSFLVFPDTSSANLVLPGRW